MIEEIKKVKKQLNSQIETKSEARRPRSIEEKKGVFDTEERLFV